MVIIVHEGYRVGDNYPAIKVADHIEDIKRVFKTSLDDRVFVQGITPHNKAYVSEEPMARLYANLGRFGENTSGVERIARVIVMEHRGKLDEKALVEMQRRAAENHHREYTKKDEEETIAFFRERHKPEEILFHQEMYSNPLVLKSWRELLAKGKTSFNKHSYDFFDALYGLSEPLEA